MTEPRDDWDAILDEHREFVEYFFADADEDVTGEELVALLLEQERDAADRMAGDPSPVSPPTHNEEEEDMAQFRLSESPHTRPERALRSQRLKNRSDRKEGSMYGPEVEEVEDENLKRLEIWGVSDAEMVEALASWLFQQDRKPASIKLLHATMEYGANENNPTARNLLSVVYETIHPVYPNG